MRLTVSTRVFAAFLVILVVFAGTVLLSVGRLTRIREDLRLVHLGYLTMSRQAMQVRTLQEAKDEYVRRARGEQDPDVRRHLVGYAREFYPRALRDRLSEMRAMAGSLARGRLSRGDGAFLADVASRTERAQRLHDAYDEASLRLLESLEELPPEDGDPLGPDPAALALAFEQRSEVLSQEVRALSLAMEAKVAEALLGAERDVREASLAAVVLSLVALAIGLFVLFMTSRALRPLHLLVESARAIGRGSLDVEVPIESDDELGALAREFNAMTRALKDRERILAARSDELLALKRFSDDVIRSIRIGIVILDAEGRVRSLNPAARSVFHLPLLDLEGRLLEEVEDLAAALAAVLERLPDVRSSGEVATFPLLRLGDRVLDVALVPIRDRAGGAHSDVLLLGEDVSAREETRERLVRSERLAAIGRLAAQITHEIRNPLSSIGLNIELLGDDVPNLPEERRAEASAILEQVAREVERLTHITEGYLRYARLPSGQDAKESGASSVLPALSEMGKAGGGARVQGDVGDLLADLCAFTQEEAGRAGVMLELQVEDGLPEVPCDPARLRQALLNLLRNAQEAAGEGGTVRLRAQRSPGAGVLVTIEDSGPGVPDDVKERLFEPFFTTKAHGTGLGLTLTKEIVAEHGGSIALVDGALGGAAFRIELPAGASG